MTDAFVVTRPFSEIPAATDGEIEAYDEGQKRILNKLLREMEGDGEKKMFEYVVSFGSRYQHLPFDPERRRFIVRK